MGIWFWSAFGMTFSSCVLGRIQRCECRALGLWTRRLHFPVLASGTALSSRSLDGVNVFGVVLWIGGPIGGVLKCVILAQRFDVLSWMESAFGGRGGGLWARRPDKMVLHFGYFIRVVSWTASACWALVLGPVGQNLRCLIVAYRF